VAAPEVTWPYGPGRPAQATAAGVLGHVTAGLTILFCVVILLLLSGGGGNSAMAALLLGLPCSIGLIAGANQILRRESERNLIAAAVLSTGVLLLSLLLGLASLEEPDLDVQVVFLVLAAPLPVLTAVFARNSIVVDWVHAGRPDDRGEMRPSG
jgi:hypothetical protein